MKKQTISYDKINTSGLSNPDDNSNNKQNIFVQIQLPGMRNVN